MIVTARAATNGPASSARTRWTLSRVPLRVARRTTPVALSVALALAAIASPVPKPALAAASTVNVPDAIDSTGASDASAALASFFRTVPDGSTVVFKAAGVYRMDTGLTISSRTGLTLDGNGATLRSNGSWDNVSSLISLRSSNSIAVRNFTLTGNDPTPGVYEANEEYAHGVLMVGGGNYDVGNVTVSNVWGDCFYVGGWADTVNVHDSSCTASGRSGMSITAGRNVTMQTSTFDRLGYCAFNIEPADTASGAVNAAFIDNTVGTYGLRFFSANGVDGSTVDGVTVSGNTVTGASLLTSVVASRRSNITFTNNTSPVAATGPVLTFWHVDGLTVTGNSEPVLHEPLIATQDSTAVSLQSDAVVSMSIVMATNVVAGRGATATVTAFDEYGAVDPAYRGTVHFTSSDPAAVLPVDYTFTGADAGVHAFTGVVLRTAGSQWVGAADTVKTTILDRQGMIAVVGADAASLSVSTATSYVAGGTHTVTVTAKDSWGNKATSYLGTVHFTSSDPSATLPADYTFTPTDAGVHVFTGGIRLRTPGTQSVSVRDTVDPSIAGTQTGISVTVATTPVAFTVTTVSSTVAGTPQSVTVTARDSCGNTVTAYRGTIHFTSTDTNALLPPDYTFNSIDAGVHTFTGVVLKTSGSRIVIATDTVTTALTGRTSSVAVSPAPTSTFTVFTGTTFTAGGAHSLTLIAKDAYGNTTPTYRGTVHVTSTDPKATLPVDYTFTSTDAGAHVFTAGVILRTAGTQSVTATDVARPAITGTQGGIVVSPGSVARFVLVTSLSPIAGTPQTVTVTAQDSPGNTVTAYRGTIHFTSSDLNAVLPADYTFTSRDAGVHAFTTLTWKTAANQWVAATDTVKTTVTGRRSMIAVSPGAAATFVVFTASSFSIGGTHSVTITVKDACGNTVKGYTGTIHFTSSDLAATLPADYTFTTADAGIHVFTGGVRLRTAGTQWVAVTDVANPAVTGRQTGIVVA